MQYVYMVRAGEKHYKFGVTENIRKRVTQLQTSNAHKIQIVTTILVKNAVEVETMIHTKLQELRTNGGTEWFELNPDKAFEMADFMNSLENNYKMLDINEKYIIREVLSQNRTWKKELEARLNNIEKKLEREPSQTIAKEVLFDDKEHISYDNLAIEIFKNEGRASTSLLQRKLGIGYSKAARIMDRLEKDGKVSKPFENNLRELYV